MNHNEQRKIENYNDANERFMLFESKTELIVLHRNMLLQQEHVVMTTSLLNKGYPSKKHYCSIVEYQDILPHRNKIFRYQKEKGNLKVFNAFFNMSIEQFFGIISQQAYQC